MNMNTSSVAPRMEGVRRGSVTSRSARQGLAPETRAASSTAAFTFFMAGSTTT